MKNDFGFKKVVGTDSVYICIADADTRAVMGAKTSRAPDLEKRWEELIAANDGEMWEWGNPPEMVSKFLDTNLKGYMHASIAEMAEVFVHGRGMGWPSAWLIEDSPLFVGQEVSSRAVDILEADSALCDFSDPRLQGIHDQWAALFAHLKDGAGKKGYKFDEIRWAIPGTARSGVTMCNRVRDGVRQLEQIESLGAPFDSLAQQMLKGFEAYAPRATAAVRRGSRRRSSLWGLTTEFTHSDDPSVTLPKRAVKIRSLGSVQRREPARHVARDTPNQYLDPSWNFYGPFEFEINCSVAAARDWHRHRSVMPWELTVMLNEKEQLIKSPYYDMSALSKGLWAETSEAFWAIFKDVGNPSWSALHALPFGATVKLKCHAKLPDLLYTLELRYSSKGANAEYKDQAKWGLYRLATLLGPSITRREKILGSLSKKDLAFWETHRALL